MPILPLLILVSAFPSFGQMTPVRTRNEMTVAAGLQLTVWAAEPHVVNPTNIDIDARGRVWYLEAVNYRRQSRKQPDYRKTGDRIVILEDTDGDGRADKKRIFDENPSLRSPLGIAILGDKVIVSQSPDLIVYTKDEHDRILKKEVLLTGWHGADHDHGLHAVVFGHDGRWYFNAGDQGFDVTDKSGRRFASSRQGPYYAGTALRVDPDGRGLTVLAHNFRNPYELAVDSFGNIWQADNDDDGNAWTRFNYVMEGGNYGYWGPGARSWREDRGTHFHAELPGVVPNVARLGAGSPCGLVIYEGKLLPAKYRGQALHAEAGKRELRTYFLSSDGAGYRLEVESTVAGADTWFRPSDVAVAPDGAVYISDWYDATVGGHNMKDIQRGRIYRLAPAGYKSRPIKPNLQTPQGLTEALGSPAQSVRYLAYTRLRAMGKAALPILMSMWTSSDPVLRARCIWLLGALGAEGSGAVEEALRDPDPNFRILGIRVLQRYFPGEFLTAVQPLLDDPSAGVRRELAVALQHVPASQSLEALLTLARSYDGKDRWYLEALGIGMRGKEEALYPRLTEAFPGAWDSRLGWLLWRLRPAAALPALAGSMNNAGLGVGQRIEAMEAVAAQASERAAVELARLIQDEAAPESLRLAALERMSKRLFSEWGGYRSTLDVVAAIQKALTTPALQAAAVNLADELEESKYGPALAALARDDRAPEELRIVAVQATGKTRVPEYVPILLELASSAALPLRMAAIRALGHARPEGLELILRDLILAKEGNELRSEALRVLARSETGAGMILDLEQKQELPAELRTLAANLIRLHRSVAIQARARKILAAPSQVPLAPPQTLVARQGDVASGRSVYFSKTGPDCASCHALEPGELSVGPNLATIGDKLGKEALLDAILNPSAGIAHEYFTWILDTKAQGQVIGILAEDSPQRVVVKTGTGEEIRLRPADITARRRSNLSMMPEDLVNRMTEEDIVNLLEFLTTLREEDRAGR